MHLKKPLILCALALLALLAGCRATTGHYVPSQAPETPTPEITATPEPTPTPTPEPTPEPTPTPPPWDPYEFGVPLEETEPVEDDSFFDNTVFLGDSRTEGFELFSGMKEHGDFYWARGMTVFKADSEEYRPFEVDGQKCSLMETLTHKQYDNVYIMLGVNELGYPAESYEEGLGKLMDRITELQPDAVVYLQVMPPLNDAMCRKNKLADYINNANLAKFNEAIVRVAAEKKVVLLNVAEVYAGEAGQLPAELAADGCHFVYSAYARWASYLRGHVMDRERYFGCREAALAEQPTDQ
ncbi:MAG: hypothetical protein HDT38_04495 [Clostridiales bacterium]|nr:hypothetical protein [Clostridiales bacterium]